MDWRAFANHPILLKPYESGNLKNNVDVMTKDDRM
jgi:hypothetical protein